MINYPAWVPPMTMDTLSGWWFGTFCIFQKKKWDVILPIDELHHFSERYVNHQPVVPSGKLM